MDTFGMRGYKITHAANPWGSGNIKQIDIPNVDSMTKEEAEAWLIKNYLIPSLHGNSTIPLMADNVQGKVFNRYVTLELKEKEEKTAALNEAPVNTMPQTLEKEVPIKQEKPKRRFRVGEHYSIFPFKNKKLKREYEVKKTIYTIEGREVRILIMKQIKGDYHTKYCLNRKDCLIYHIKYEEGLEVFSMDLDWKLLNKKEKKL